MTRANAAPMLIVWSISSPSPSSFGCWQLALKCWIAKEVVVFKGTFNPVFAHAIAISGDTEGYVCGGGVGPGACWRSGSVRETNSITSAPPLGRKTSLVISKPDVAAIRHYYLKVAKHSDGTKRKKLRI
jgi:hypothetical protein